MDAKWMAKQLPEEPPKGMLSWAMDELEDELGANVTIMASERVPEAVSMAQIMDNQTTGKKVWAMRCRCSVCQEDYYAAKIPGQDGFAITEGEDGWAYPVMPGEPVTGDNVVPIYQNDGINCPICGGRTTVISAKDIRGGRTKQIQTASLHSVWGYAVIVYWLVQNLITPEGCVPSAAPRYAFVLGERGGITAYTHRYQGAFGNDSKGREWRQLSDNYDRWETSYHDWQSINNTKIGTVPYRKEIPSLDDTTGEKTGLAKYWKESAAWPVDYLRMWKACRPVENLVNEGFSYIIQEAVTADGYGYRGVTALSDVVDTGKSKPHEMFRMSKQEYKQIKTRKPLPTWNDLNLWKEYKGSGGTVTAPAFLDAVGRYHNNGMRALITMMQLYKDCDIPKVDRYMEKQHMQPWETGTLLDTRNMTKELNRIPRPLTSEELWPRNLGEAHARLTATIITQEDAEKAARFQIGFAKVLEKYGELQWTDGDLQMILPKNNGDLIREGAVLRHCVGGYGPEHSRGKNIIFFVRHHRRPERCYYTLNVSFTPGQRIREIQLHGYGNERHGDRKQYFHSIPQKVRDFCTRWEKEIAGPWWAAQQKQEDKTA